MSFSERPAYRLLSIEHSPSTLHYFGVAISPTGCCHDRLAVLASEEGIVFWDLEEGVKLGTASIGPTYALTFEASGALWTNGPNGVRRWPMKDITQSTVGIGPPQLVFPRGNTNQISCSLDGLVVAIPQPDGALVIHRGEHDRPTRSSVIKQHEDARYVSVSGDGAIRN